MGDLHTLWKNNQIDGLYVTGSNMEGQIGFKDVEYVYRRQVKEELKGTKSIFAGSQCTFVLASLYFQRN